MTQTRQSDVDAGDEWLPDEISPQPASSLADVPWTLYDIAWATVVFGLIFGAFAVTFAVVRFLEVSFAPEGSPYVSGVLLMILEAALIIPVWLFAIRKYNIGWGTLGFRSFNVLAGCGLVVALLMVSFTVNVIWAGILSLFDLGIQQEILPAFGGGTVGLGIAWVAAGIVAPLVEESFFRGFLLPALLQKFSFWTAAAINALVFALIHFQPAAVVPFFTLGVFFCLLYRVTNSIWPSVLMHATMNTLAVLAAYALEIGLVPAPPGT